MQHSKHARSLHSWQIQHDSLPAPCKHAHGLRSKRSFPLPTLSILPSLAHSERTSASNSSLASGFSMNSSGLNMCFKMTVTWGGRLARSGEVANTQGAACGAPGACTHGNAAAEAEGRQAGEQRAGHANTKWLVGEGCMRGVRSQTLWGEHLLRLQRVVKATPAQRAALQLLKLLLGLPGCGEWVLESNRVRPL